MMRLTAFSAVRHLSITVLGTRETFFATSEVYPCDFPHSEQNFAVRGMDWPQLVQNFVATPVTAGGGVTAVES